MNDILLRTFGDYTVISVPERSSGADLFTGILKYKGDQIASQGGFRSETASLGWAQHRIREHKEALLAIQAEAEA